MGQTYEGRPPEEILDLFLEVEFLHSLGCYTNARTLSKKIRKCDLGCGEALRRTAKLNRALDRERDNPKEEWRHPGPVQGTGVMLDNRDGTPDPDDADRIRLITDFYNAGQVALKYLLNPGEAEIPAHETGRRSLETLGECLFWERDPGSAVFGVNEDFVLRQKQLAESRAGEGEVPKPTPRVKRRIEAKRERFAERQKEVEDALKPRLTYKRDWDEKRAGETAEALCGVNLTTPANGDALRPGFVIECMVAAHLRLHYVEHFLSAPFRKAVGMSEADRKDALRRLREAESLNTFVYVACWSLPWLFADGEGEMKAVRDGCFKGFGHGEKDRNDGPASDNSPTPDEGSVKESDDAVFPALWRAQRLAILALHRRAFGHSLRDALVEETFNDTAFKDFHKLQRLLRVQRRELPEEPSSGDQKTDKPKVTPEAFLAGMDALAETHIGDLYRSDHAHPVALEHFCDAQDRLDQLSVELLRAESESDAGKATEAVGPKSVTHSEGPQNVAKLLRDSRWRIHLMLSKGKGFYEAGKLKRSVKWLLKSWSALLVLVDFYESEAGKKRRPEWKEVDVEVFDRLEEAIEMLKLIRNDPDFRKSDLRNKLEPVIADIEKAEIPEGLQVIASEILLRLGHVLFILRLDARPEDDKHPRRRASDIGTEKDDELPHACLKRAKELDKRSTLVAADQLKIEYKRNETPDRDALSEPELQWPYGRGNPDQIIRMIEYHLLWWLTMTRLAAKANSSEPGAGAAKPVDPAQSVRPRDSHDAHREPNRNIARELIAGLLTHTDSINVRQSQVYRYLMQPKRPTRRIGPVEGWDEDPPRDPFGEGEGAAIEFVCLRRYSSFFPFVPRPSAFRSLGGGYLLRLHHEDDGCPRPFGIAVDPGPDFIDNLYRCGFGLGDINMIILTHDHPDHSVDLDPILALLGYRMKQGDPTYQAPGKRGEAVRRLLIVGNESVTRQLRFFNKPHVSAPGASRPVRRDAVQVVSFDEFDTFREETNRVRETERVPEVVIPDELRLKPVVSIRHLDSFGMLAYGFRLSLGDKGPSIGFTGDTGGFLLEQEETVTARGGDPSRQWRIKPHDQHETMKLTGDSTWREHWEDVLSADVLVPHVSGLPLSQLLVLANGGDPTFRKAGDELRDEKLTELLQGAWNGLEESVRKQVTFAFWLPDSAGVSSLPLEEIEKKYKWQKGHLYLIGLLEFARAYREARRYVAKPGLFLIGELREELGSLRGKIATSLNRNIFEADMLESEPGCSALTADIGMRLMISREKGEARVRVLCSTCDLDNDRTREERFHDPKEIREVCVKGENEGMFYNCSNHDPSHHRNPVFLERVERYDVFSPVPIH